MLNFEEISRQICEKENLEILKILRTLSGIKQTLLCQREKDKVVLSIGEQRPPVFRNGFESEKIVIPRIIKQDVILTKDFSEAEVTEVPYEIEECLEGEAFTEIWAKREIKGIPLSEDLEEEIIKVYIDLRELFDNLLITKEFISTFSEWFRRVFWKWITVIKAKNLITFQDQDRILGKIADHPDYNKLVQPEISHGHFAITHFIRMPDGRTGIVDLTHFGLRPRYYDLAFLLWSHWFWMREEILDKPEEIWEYMKNFFKKMQRNSPKEFQDEISLKQFYLVLLERILGALYDIAITTDHVEQIFKEEEQRQKLTKFLQKILECCLEALSFPGKTEN